MNGLKYNLDLVYELTKKEIKARYKSSFLGCLWSLLNPLGMAMVFNFCFNNLLGIRMTESRWPFMLFLIAGLFPWQWFSNSLVGSAGVYIGNSSLVRKVAFRRELLPLATVLNDAFHFFISVFVILGFLIIYGGRPSLSILYGLPALMVAQLLLTYGLGLIVSSVNVFFRDLSHLIGILLQMWFYLTPIIYDINTVGKSRPWAIPLLKCNPMTVLIEGYRQLFLEGRFAAQEFVLAMIMGMFAMAMGWLVHSRLKWKYAELI